MNPAPRMLFLMILFTASLVCGAGAIAQAQNGRMLESLSSQGFHWPSWSEFIKVAALRNYNTRLVVLSAASLGVASGLVGTFLMLRKRSLMGDALSHACLPGIGLTFILLTAMGGDGKSLGGLLLGATVSGLVGVAAVLAIRNTTRIKDDAAMGLVLSVFFGIGAAILGMVQAMPGASAAGLEYFIYGKAASMVFQDFVLIASIALAAAVLSVALFKEFAVLCFDDAYAWSQGYPIQALDLLMLAMVAAVTVVGLQAVGLILIIAFLITPSAAARFWTNNLKMMLLLSALIGGASGWLGASLSALQPRLPAGAVIVLVAAAMFIFSMVFGRARGVLVRALASYRLHNKIGRQDLLRSIYEILESTQYPDVSSEGTAPPRRLSVNLDRLLIHRTWSLGRLKRLIASAERDGLVESIQDNELLLSPQGFSEAARITRNHRLWEIYLIQYADIAPYHVDRDADAVEHVLGDELSAQLEAELVRQGRAPRKAVPPPPDILPGALAT